LGRVYSQTVVHMITRPVVCIDTSQQYTTTPTLDKNGIIYRICSTTLD